MGRFNSNSSYDHRIKREREDEYVISWIVDFYYASSRLCWPRGFRRYTNEAGARRFAKKHNIEMPTENKETKP